MLAGALPYREIFDIKPVGIFALHVLTAAFGPFSRMAIDIVATAFAAATGCVIFAIVRKLVGARADAVTSAACGLFAALLYIAYLPVFDGPPALYATTHACFATRFAFPQHLENTRFAAYPPGSQVAEIRRIMATRPGAVVMGSKPLSQTDPAARAVVSAALTAGYRRAATLPVGEARYDVWVREDAGSGR